MCNVYIFNVMKVNILFLFFISTSFVYSSERGQIPYSESTDESIPTYQSRNVLTKNIILLNNNSYLINKPMNNNRITSGPSLSLNYKSQKSAFYIFLIEHRQQFIFTGIGLVAGIISGIFNREAKSRYDKEKSLYEVYINASKDSDFNKLWNEYKKAADKTDRYLNLRGIFGTCAGVIGASLLISIVVEGNF